MAQVERVVAVVLCVGCLAVPLAVMLSGALEPEEVHVVGDGKVFYVRDKEGLEIKGLRGSRESLPVRSQNSGKAFTETSADDIPTRVNEERAHADAHEIPVGSPRRSRGAVVEPAPPAE